MKVIDRWLTKHPYWGATIFASLIYQRDHDSLRLVGSCHGRRMLASLSMGFKIGKKHACN